MAIYYIVIQTELSGAVGKLDKHQHKVEASFRQQAPKSVKEARERDWHQTQSNACSGYL